MTGNMGGGCHLVTRAMLVWGGGLGMFLLCGFYGVWCLALGDLCNLEAK